MAAELRTSLEGEPSTRPITRSTQPSETVAAEDLSKVRAGDDEGLAAGGLAERQRRALKKAIVEENRPISSCNIRLILAQRPNISLILENEEKMQYQADMAS